MNSHSHDYFDAPEAPVHYDADEARAWQAGYERAVADAVKAVEASTNTRPVHHPKGVTEQAVSRAAAAVARMGTPR